MARNFYQKAPDQRALNTIALWTGWAISAIAVFVMMYRKANIIGFIQHDETRITWIILGMFIMGVAISLMHAMKLTGEWFRAYRIESMVKDKGLASVKLGGRHVVDRFVESLRIIMERNGRLDLEVLIDVEFSRQRKTSQFVGLLGNLMITLGLIGTVLGMTITMNGLHGALGSLGIDQSLLVDGLRTAMNGMGVAFYTTLMGSVLGGVLLRVFSWITETSVDGLQDVMLRTCLVYASGDIEPTAERDMRALETTVEQLHARIELLNLAIKTSREEMHYMGQEALQMHEDLKKAVEDDPIRNLARSHAVYAMGVRPSLFTRLFRKPNKDKGDNK